MDFFALNWYHEAVKEVSALGFVNEISKYISMTTIFPVITLCFLGWFFFYYFKVLRPVPGTSEWIAIETRKTGLSIMAARHPMEKLDVIPLVLLMAAFTFLALFRLGDFVAPQSFFQFNDKQKEVLIQLEKPSEIGMLKYYTGLWTGHYKLEVSSDGVTWHEQAPIEKKGSDDEPTPAMNQPHSNLFKWRYATLNTDNPEVKYIRLTASRTPIELGEIALYDKKNNLIPHSQIRTSPPEAMVLFDEQELIPDRPTYMNGMYFDEIYHGRTALEFLRSEEAYETTHPPLGKALIACSIYVFGMTPFGWRFIGAIFGVIMLLVLYVFLKNMFGKTLIAACGTLLLGFDFMRFVQTRIATIDTYGVFFILLAYFFMYRYITTPADAGFRKSLAPLALSGIAFGLGCASKWIVIYAGAGLAVMYAIRLIQLGLHYRKVGQPGFAMYLLKTLLFSVLFFIVVPATIYYLSYIPFAMGKGLRLGEGMLWDPEYIEIVKKNQELMFNYHGRLEAEHPYSSWWWQWILNAKPILYVNNNIGNLRSSFAAFGNPVIWWGGFVAMVVMGIRVFTHRDGKALFILIGYLSQLLPWVPITRIVFIYHYFPSTLFLVLALAHMFNTIVERRRDSYKPAVYGFTAAAGLLFLMFFPALSGLPAPQGYFTHLLRWIPILWPL